MPSTGQLYLFPKMGSVIGRCITGLLAKMNQSEKREALTTLLIGRTFILQMKQSSVGSDTMSWAQFGKQWYSLSDVSLTCKNNTIYQSTLSKVPLSPAPRELFILSGPADFPHLRFATWSIGFRANKSERRWEQFWWNYMVIPCLLMWSTLWRMAGLESLLRYR